MDSSPWNFQGKSTGVGCHFLLQGILLTQGSNSGLLHCRQRLYLWATRDGILSQITSTVKNQTYIFLSALQKKTSFLGMKKMTPFLPSMIFCRTPHVTSLPLRSSLYQLDLLQLSSKLAFLLSSLIYASPTQHCYLVFPKSNIWSCYFLLKNLLLALYYLQNRIKIPWLNKEPIQFSC